MDIDKRLYEIGIIPVIEIGDPAQAVDLGKALIAGGLPAAEVTLRTDSALESIAILAEELPDLLVGAGTVLDVEHAQAAIEAGARFVVSPGTNVSVVDYCVSRGVPVYPGVATPSEVQTVIARGITTMKLFPAEVLGGVKLLKALAGPFGKVRFMCTGGINASNVTDYLAQPNVIAVGGSWMVPKDLIRTGDFAAIERLCREAVAKLHGFELLHVGINARGEENAQALAQAFSAIFDLPVREFPAALFAGTAVEVVKDAAPGDNGHIAIATNDVGRAMAYLESKGYEFTEDGLARDDKGIIAVYLKDYVGGFGIHLRRKG